MLGTPRHAERFALLSSLVVTALLALLADVA